MLVASLKNPKAANPNIQEAGTNNCDIGQNKNEMIVIFKIVVNYFSSDRLID